MSRSPAHLRAAAMALRAMAAALAADTADLVRQGGLSTWRGPAAERHRAGALVQQRHIDAVVDELWRIANELVNTATVAEANEQHAVEVRERRWSEAER